MPDNRSTEGTTDPVAAALDEIRSRHHQIPDPATGSTSPCVCASDRHRWPCHAHRLGEAVSGVLELPEKWAAVDDGPASALTEDRAWIRQDCAADLSEAISRALLGEEAANG